MVQKSVAVDGDASATAGSKMFGAATSGTWTPAAVSVRTYDALRVGGTKAIFEASCSFSFVGKDDVPNAVAGSETVTLTAGSTPMQSGRGDVLIDGDSKEGDYGNIVSVNAGGVLRTQK